MDGGPQTYHARRAEPAPTTVVEPEEDEEIEPEDEEEEPASKPDREYVPDEDSDSDSDLASEPPKSILLLLSLHSQIRLLSRLSHGPVALPLGSTDPSSSSSYEFFLVRLPLVSAFSLRIVFPLFRRCSSYSSSFFFFVSLLLKLPSLERDHSSSAAVRLLRSLSPPRCCSSPSLSSSPWISSSLTAIAHRHAAAPNRHHSSQASSVTSTVDAFFKSLPLPPSLSSYSATVCKFPISLS
ncbi:hypothetical protein RIF29_20050 [Crotalaria pallida]|uniref:Uncharacterized protein n=1 Tax=Crotalaria pallida TaxID=3830 RepID=A0AAN9F8X4_CROPI